ARFAADPSHLARLLADRYERSGRGVPSAVGRRPHRRGHGVAARGLQMVVGGCDRPRHRAEPAAAPDDRRSALPGVGGPDLLGDADRRHGGRLSGTRVRPLGARQPVLHRRRSLRSDRRRPADTRYAAADQTPHAQTPWDGGIEEGPAAQPETARLTGSKTPAKKSAISERASSGKTPETYWSGRTTTTAPSRLIPRAAKMSSSGREA